MNFPKHVTIIEVSPRDGLQNEPTLIPTDKKVEFINKLSETGLTRIEVTSFVSSKKIPQLADHNEIFGLIEQKPNVSYSALVPNMHGLDNAIESNVKEIGVFGAVSETFSQRNINCTTAESLQRFAQVIPAAKKQGLRVRGYISCALGCPYEGEEEPAKVADYAKALFDLGCYEISIGDTIGVGTPLKVKAALEAVLKYIPSENIAVHFHDSYGQALANILMALEMGISHIDASVAGLGGCPYAKGATGNVATEDVVYCLNGLGIETGIDIEKLARTGQWMSDYLQRNNESKAARAILANLF